MMYNYLILAEKNSLAQSIAKAFAGHQHKNGYYEASDPAIGTAKIYYTFGHILETDVKETLAKAGYNYSIPIFPKLFVMAPRDNRKTLFKQIASAIKKNDYTAIINAGDPDREGELLIREVLNYAKTDKPKYRLWFNSTQKTELRRALQDLKPMSEYDHLYAAALGRQYADFYIGINGSIGLQKKTGSGNQSIGRVQTPVLKLIVERDLKIEHFKPVTYFILKIECKKDRSFRAEYIDTNRKENVNRLSKEEADNLFEEIKSESFADVLSIKKEHRKQLPPKLPKLSDMQIEAGTLFKYKADKVLQIIQGLYEKGIVSYPRTDSSYLSANDKSVVIKSLNRLGRTDLTHSIPSRIFNDKDVAEAGHHAIIPLDKLPDNITREETQVYKLIERRFIAQFYRLYEYETTVVILGIGEHRFKAAGKVDKILGWKQLYREQESNDEQVLPVMSEGEKIVKTDTKILQKQTKPPRCFTSASLIKKMSQLELGTQATRSNYEPLLVRRGYITSVKEIHATELGKQLIVSGVGKMTFADPEFSAKWDKYLNNIIKKRPADYKDKMKSFMEKAKRLTTLTCEEIGKLRIEKIKIDITNRNTIGKCACGGDIVIMNKVYKCAGCGKYLFKTVFGKKLTQRQALFLMQKKELTLKSLKSRKGEKFSAFACMNQEGNRWKVRLRF